jgi:hypothetical protein
MRLMSRATLATLLGLVLVGSLPATSVWAWDSTCHAGEACIWKDGPFGTPLAATSVSDNNYVGDYYPGTTNTLNDTASSVTNNKSANDVIWHVDAGYGGTPLCIDSGKDRANLYGLNDAFSSHSVTEDDNC